MESLQGCCPLPAFGEPAFWAFGKKGGIAAPYMELYS